MQKIRSFTYLSFVFIILTITAISGCSRNPEIHGHIFKPEELAGIEPGLTTKEDILKKLGTPSSKSDFGAETWYYIGKKTQSVAFFEPEIKEQHVLALEFNGESLKSIKNLGLEDAKKIAFSKDSTPTEGHSIGFFEQILGNVGKFNKTESARTPGSKLPGQ